MVRATKQSTNALFATWSNAERLILKEELPNIQKERTVLKAPTRNSDEGLLQVIPMQQMRKIPAKAIYVVPAAPSKFRP